MMSTRTRSRTWTRDWAERAIRRRPCRGDRLPRCALRQISTRWRKPEQLTPGDLQPGELSRGRTRVRGLDDLARRADAVNDALRARPARRLLPARPLSGARLRQPDPAVCRRGAQRALRRTGARQHSRRRQTKCGGCFHRDHELRDTYNHSMAGGKWNHMMDQTHIGYFDWYPPEADIMPAVAEIDLDRHNPASACRVDGSARSWPGYYLPPALPTLDSLTRAPDLSRCVPARRGAGAVTVTADQPWVTIREGQGVQRFTAGSAVLDRRRLGQGAGRPIRGARHHQGGKTSPSTPR